MEYADIAQARRMPGLRLILTAGVPGPWGEAIKAILDYKQLEFVPVRQEAGTEDRELFEWTRQFSAPVLAYEQEPPRCSWLDQLMLAERLEPSKPLLPADIEHRALVIGLSRELAGERGLGWNRRLQLFGPAMLSGDAPAAMCIMAARYGFSEAEYAASHRRVADSLAYFASRLRLQHEYHNEYLVGAQLTAADLYLVNFLGMLQPLPAQLNPMPDYLRQMYSTIPDEIAGSMDPLLFEYRDRVYERHITTPLEF